jgi:hypothetical protein
MVNDMLFPNFVEHSLGSLGIHGVALVDELNELPYWSHRITAKVEWKRSLSTLD